MSRLASWLGSPDLGTRRQSRKGSTLGRQRGSVSNFDQTIRRSIGILNTAQMPSHQTWA
jgi:hypothetical protein